MKTFGILILILLSTSSFAFKKDTLGKLLTPRFSTVPECQSRPEFLSEVRSDFVSSLEVLPQTVLVARDAEYYVEEKNADKAVTVYGYQSFLEEHSSEVLCGQVAGGSSQNQRFSLVAPTLIDTYKTPRVGQSLWQFQLMTNGNKFSFWNLKSASFTINENLETWLKDSDTLYKIYQKSHNEYELLLVKKERDLTQYLSIRYDAISNVKLR